MSAQAIQIEPRRAEVNTPVRTDVVQLKDGRVIKRVTYNTGNTVETLVSPLDYRPTKGAKPNMAGELLMEPR